MHVFFYILLIVFFLFSCNPKEEKKANDVYYTCSMDPQVVEFKQGKCPICKMPLTEVKKGHMLAQDELELSDQQVQLGSITIDTLREHLLGEDILLTGTVKPNQNTISAISSRVMGRIEKLYFKTTGDVIAKGQPLYEIYSEDLNTIIKEMLLAAEEKRLLKNSEVDMDKILQSARNKLLLFGLTEEQVKQLEDEGIQPYTVKILSTTDGVIYSVDADEGNYVMEGGSVFHIADFTHVWVEAQVYSDYMDEIKNGVEAKIIFPGLQAKDFFGKILFINPELNPASKINVARMEIPNSGGDLKPGMQAYVSLLLKQRRALSLPTDAVIKDAKGSLIWIQTGHNKFKSVMVHTGLESNGYTEILHGAGKGVVVVVTGAYLLNSEYIFKKGFSSMAGHDMK